MNTKVGRVFRIAYAIRSINFKEVWTHKVLTKIPKKQMAGWSADMSAFIDFQVSLQTLVPSNTIGLTVQTAIWQVRISESTSTL